MNPAFVYQTSHFKFSKLLVIFFTSFCVGENLLADSNLQNSTNALKSVERNSHQPISKVVTLYKEIFEKNLHLARQGDLVAQYTVGMLSSTGQGTSQSYKKAVEWYERSAEKGFASAQYGLGQLYAVEVLLIR